MGCNHKNKNCGCNDQALTVSPNFSNDPSICPPNSEPCAEVFDMECIRWTGPDVCELGINNGDKLNEVIQKVVMGIRTLACEGIEVTIPDLPEPDRGFSITVERQGTPTYYFLDDESYVAIGGTSGDVFPDTNVVTQSLLDATLGLDDLRFVIDRNNCFEDIEVTLTNDPGNAVDLEAFGGANTITIPAALKFIPGTSITFVSTPPIGTYLFNLTFSTTNCGSRTFYLQINITA